MKLIAKAKPVNIRIKSGGEEHTSLDSLRRNFNISDIVPLLDGRLVRWLRQQGENELANIIVDFDISQLNTLQGVMNLIKPFFSEYIEEHSIKNILTLLVYWLKSSSYRENGEHLFYNVINDSCSCYEDDKYLNIVKYLYKNKDNLKCPKLDWFSLFIKYKKDEEGKTDSEVLYFIGKMLWDGYQYNDSYINNHFKEDGRGLELIQEAARLGNKDANLLIFNYNLNQEKSKGTGRFAGVNRDKLKHWINHNWNGDFEKFKINFTWDVYHTLEFNAADYSNEKEKYILNFICDCYYLVSVCSNETWKSTLKEAMHFFFPKGEENSDNDILKKEKCFIVGLLKKLNGYDFAATRTFIEAGDYPPALYMLSVDRLINYTDLKNMTFPSQLSFVIRNLFYYE